MAIEFNESAKKELEKIMGRYPSRQAALLPALYLAQREFGYVSEEVIAYLSRLMELPKSRIFGVASFYTMFNKKPVGKYFIQVCANISCAMMGADSLFEYLSQKLGIKEGETTKDGKFTLVKVECLGACGEAPTMQVNDRYYGNLTKARVDQILAELK
jgi:NADH-quinone oxidoreductase subunit E